MKKTGNTHHRILDNYRYLYRQVWQYDKKIIIRDSFSAVFAVAATFTGVLIPTIIIWALEMEVGITRFIAMTCGVMAAFGLLQAGAAYLKSVSNMHYIPVRMIYWTKQFMNKVISSDYEIQESPEARTKYEKAEASIFQGNLGGLEGFMHNNVSLLENCLGLILYSAVITTIHPLIIVILFAISLLQLSVFVKVRDYRERFKDERAKAQVTKAYFETESYDIASGKDIRLYGIRDWLIEQYKRVIRQVAHISAKVNGADYLYEILGIVLRFIRDAISYGYLIYLLSDGLSVSNFVLYLGMVSGFASWFTSIADNIGSIGKNLYDIDDFRNYLEIKERKNGEESIRENDHEGLDIVFDRVTYCYPGCEKPVLNQVSFHIRPGEKIALVGINGAGKTTIVKLLSGLYHPTSGHIYVNGTDMEEINTELYFEKIAAIFQDAITLSLTIAENIAGEEAEQINPSRLRQAISRAGLAEKINSLPDREKTYLNKDISSDGISLSGGERQKLILARALYKDPSFLLLDEPTAAMDAIAESETYELYQKLLKKKTAVFISHRLASTRFCDRILFLEDGVIKEEGTHEELVLKKGSYSNMYQVQKKYYEDGLEGEKDEADAKRVC